MQGNGPAPENATILVIYPRRRYYQWLLRLILITASVFDRLVLVVDEPIPLEFLPCGQSAVVEELYGSPDDVVRLEELGVRSGRSVEMVQSGSPCIIRVNGQKLCFRDGEALGVLVRPQVAE